jgi:dipeptidyl aminopeptidase/acylaminoacyl peptidase
VVRGVDQRRTVGGRDRVLDLEVAGREQPGRCTGARNSDMFAAGGNYAGVIAWWGLLGLEKTNAPDLAQARKVAAAASPLASIAGWRSPVLVIHGDDDLNVDVSQSITLVRALERRGVRVEQMLLPDQSSRPGGRPTS